MMTTNIADHVADCFKAFKSVFAVPVGEAQDSPDKAGRKIKNEFSRFKVWSGNIGAHQRGKSSLDYRLRDASHLSSEVINLLIDLRTLLDTACSILAGTKVPWDQEIPDDDEEYDEDSNSPEDIDIGFSTELDQISTDVVEVIDCLLKLSVSIRNPAPHDRFQASIKTDTSFYEPADIAHVKAKCGNADPRLIEQLGKANSRRRQYFKYRELHHQKLSQGQDLNLEGKSVAERQSTVASSIPSGMKIIPPEITDTINVDELSDSGITQTSYAPSMETSNRPRLPRLPAESANRPFECPFCFMMITVSTSYAWRKHIYADLRPYSCVAVNCPLVGTEFGRRRQWMEHILQYHWRDWHCAFCAHEPFTSPSNFQDHLKNEHAEAVSRNELEAATHLCERPRPFGKDTKCPICHCALESVRKYRHHVGGHLEDIALFVLPRVHENEMSGEDSEDGIEQASSHNATDYDEVKIPQKGNSSDLNWSDGTEPFGEDELAISDENRKDTQAEVIALVQQAAGDQGEAVHDADTGYRKQEAKMPTAVEDSKNENEKKMEVDEAFMRKGLKEAKATAHEEAEIGAKDQAPIRFKDAVGRKFSFPLHICQQWTDMEELIKQAFLHVDVLGPHVQQGHYDLLGPDQEIILPQVWDSIIKPDMLITMVMWPIFKQSNISTGSSATPAHNPSSMRTIRETISHRLPTVTPAKFRRRTKRPKADLGI